MKRLLAVAVLAAIFGLTLIMEPGPAPGATSTLVAGLVLLLGHVVGRAAGVIGLPRITGYLGCGLLFGPDALAVISEPVADRLHFLNELAIAFIALAAGAELRLEDLRQRWGLIGALVASSSLLVLLGVGLLVFLIADWLLPFAVDLSTVQQLAVAALFGVLAVARSPSSALAVIRDCKARGPFSETALGVTVAIDVVTIVLFAVVLSTCQAVLSGGGLDVAFAVSVLVELGAGTLFGALLGFVLAFYIRRWPANIALVLLGTALVVTEVAHGTAQYVQSTQDLPLRLEPLLICVTAGFVVRNTGAAGARFSDALEGVSLPVFVLFFTLAGAGLDLTALQRAWPAALVLVTARAVTILGGSFLGGRLAGEAPARAGLYGFTFLAQAGVSIGLALEVVRRFPEWGDGFATLVVAVISLNQVLGPVAMKFALHRVGEAGAAGGAR